MNTATRPKRASVGEIKIPTPQAAPLDIAPEPEPLFEAAPEEGEIMFLSEDQLEVWEKNARLFRDPDDVEDLAKSVKADGQDDELKVRPKPGFPDRYEIIEGGTRFEGRARKVWRCRVYKLLSDKAALDMAGRSQFKRRDWGALDRANWYRLERDEMPNGAQTSYRELGDALGVSHEQIRHYLNLLELPLTVQRVFARTKIKDAQGRLSRLSEGHGREIFKLQGHEAAQLALLKWIKENNANTDKTSKEAKRQLQELGVEPKTSTKAKKKAKDDAKLSLDFGDGEGDQVSTRVDSPILGRFLRGDQVVTLRANGAESLRPMQGNPDDAELPKEDDWRSSVRAQFAGVNGVASSAPAATGTGFATAPEMGSTMNAAPGQWGNRSVVIGAGAPAATAQEWKEAKGAQLFLVAQLLRAISTEANARDDLTGSDVQDVIDQILTDVKPAYQRVLGELESLRFVVNKKQPKGAPESAYSDSPDWLKAIEVWSPVTHIAPDGTETHTIVTKVTEHEITTAQGRFRRGGAKAGQGIFGSSGKPGDPGRIVKPSGLQ